MTQDLFKISPASQIDRKMRVKLKAEQKQQHQTERDANGERWNRENL